MALFANYIGSNGMRFDLQHPNEYVRGNTLRFVCKLKDAELVEPLLQPVRAPRIHRNIAEFLILCRHEPVSNTGMHMSERMQCTVSQDNMWLDWL
jgi:hypothetical protein